MADNALWRLQVCVFTTPMGDGNPENIHLLKTSCNNLSETKSFRGHSASTVSPLGSTPVLFYFRLSLISPPVSEHSLRRWTENRRTEQGFRCLYVRKQKNVSEWEEQGSFLRGHCILKNTKEKCSVVAALGSVWEDSFNAGQRDYHIDPSLLTLSAYFSPRAVRRCALIDWYWPKILTMTLQLRIESEKTGWW